MYMTAGTTFTGVTGTTYSATGLVAQPDVRLALMNGWTIPDQGNESSFITSTVASGAAIALTTATPANITSISVGPGTWDLTAVADFSPAGTTTVTTVEAGVSVTSATFASQAGGSGLGTDPNSAWAQASEAPGANLLVRVIGQVRLTVTIPTTVYLVAQAAFSTSTLSAYGTLSARKVF